MLRDRNLFPLSHSHHRALGLCVLVRRDLARDPSPPNVERLAARVLDRYDDEIRSHFLIEERVLFPALAPWPELVPLLDELLAEHARMAALISCLQTNPNPGSLDRFCVMLSDHIRKEERSLFERMQQLLSPSQLSDIGARLAPTASPA
ncbi:MAG: hemerythrin domain-containing protein [Bryobacterales bacterium]|nr:hemerythrin domain-containing protein [Bryobacterales bacterium]